MKKIIFLNLFIVLIVIGISYAIDIIKIQDMDNLLSKQDITNYSLQFNSYCISDIDNSSSQNFYGYIDYNGNWYIMKETLLDTTYNTTDTYRYHWSNNENDYDSNWKNRKSLNYGRYDSIF